VIVCVVCVYVIVCVCGMCMCDCVCVVCVWCVVCVVYVIVCMVCVCMACVYDVWGALLLPIFTHNGGFEQGGRVYLLCLGSDWPFALWQRKFSIKDPHSTSKFHTDPKGRAGCRERGEFGRVHGFSWS